MKSPFPGIDPFIEGCGLWESFHYQLIADMTTALSEKVPDHYVVRPAERSYVVFVEPRGTKRKPFLPDVSIATVRRARKKASGKGTAAVLDAPIRMKPLTRKALEEEHREAYVNIYEADPRMRLVTSIEVLSPSNKKPGTPGWEQYQQKRETCLAQGVHLVEIDLLRGGEKMPMADPYPDCAGTYLVARTRSAFCHVWPVQLRQPLPILPVPLAKPDPDIPLALQPLADAVYHRLRFDLSIGYSKPLAPPLSGEECAWLKNCLRTRKRYSSNRRNSCEFRYG